MAEAGTKLDPTRAWREARELVWARRERLAAGLGLREELTEEASPIVERGTHSGLLALGRRYRLLHDRKYHFEADLYLNPGEEAAAAAVPPRPVSPRSTTLPRD